MLQTTVRAAVAAALVFVSLAGCVVQQPVPVATPAPAPVVVQPPAPPGSVVLEPRDVTGPEIEFWVTDSAL